MEKRVELIRALQERADVLSARSVAAACSGSFWDERYGERGRRRIVEDAHHHITQLTTALGLDHPSLMTEYARWLQQILTNRGMCTRHIVEHFTALREAIRTEEMSGTRIALEYVSVAIDALRYDREPARTIQDAADSIVETVARAADRRGPAQSGGVAPERLRKDLRYLVSYLGDAAALDNAAVFEHYLTWIDGYFERRGRPSQYLVEIVSALNAAVHDLPTAARETCIEIVTRGTALNEPPGRAPH